MIRKAMRGNRCSGNERALHLARSVYAPIGYPPDANVLAHHKNLQCDLDFRPSSTVPMRVGQPIE